MTDSRVLPPLGRGKNRKPIRLEDFPEQPKPKGADQLKGARYGHLECLYFAGLNRQGRAMWACKCHNCGNYTIAAALNMKQGNTVSCGCIQRERPVKPKAPVRLDPYRQSLVDGLKRILKQEGTAE